MRQKTNNLFPELFSDTETVEAEAKRTNKNVQHFRDLYKTLGEYLEKYPEIEQLAHEKLVTLCKPEPARNRTPDFTTQNLFRIVLVSKIQDLSLRETEVLIAEMKTLQNFCRQGWPESLDRKWAGTSYNATVFKG